MFSYCFQIVSDPEPCGIFSRTLVWKSLSYPQFNLLVEEPWSSELNQELHPGLCAALEKRFFTQGSAICYLQCREGTSSPKAAWKILWFSSTLIEKSFFIYWNQGSEYILPLVRERHARLQGAAEALESSIRTGDQTIDSPSGYQRERKWLAAFHFRTMTVERRRRRQAPYFGTSPCRPAQVVIVPDTAFTSANYAKGPV